MPVLPAINLSATNAFGTGPGTLVITALVPLPVITSPLTASGTIGTYFSYQITATNSPFIWNATGLPAGLSVNTFTGLIDGTPTGSGVTSILLSATNGGGTGYQNLTLTVQAPAPVLGIAGYGVTDHLTAKLLFANESISQLSSQTIGVYGLPGSYNSLTAGYVCGGGTATTTEKLFFSSDTWANIGFSVSARAALNGFNSSAAGYAMGGGYGFNGFDKVTFSTDSGVTVTGTLPLSFSEQVCYQSSISGYCAGGHYLTAAIMRTLFVSDTSAVLAAALVGAADNLSGGFNSPVAGYTAGGSNYFAVTSVVNKLTFSSESNSALGATLSVPLHVAGGTNSITNGYVLGGREMYSSPIYFMIHRVNFSSDAVAVISASMPANQPYSGGFENLN